MEPYDDAGLIVPSVRVRTRRTKDGSKRYRVLYRLGGRESTERYGGSFVTRKLALTRKAWIIGELAAQRVPDLRLLAQEAPTAPTLREVADRWRESRVDVADSTRVLHRVALDRVLPILGDRPVDGITVADITDLVGRLHRNGRKRETIAKSVTCLAQTLDHAGIAPNPARDKLHVKLPRRNATNSTRPPPTMSRPSTARPGRASAAAAVARLVRRSCRVGRHLRGSEIRRAAATSTATGERQQVPAGLVGRPARRTRRRHPRDAAAARGSRPRNAAVRRVRVERAAHRDREGMPRARDPAVVAARPAPPARIPAAPAGPLMGENGHSSSGSATSRSPQHVYARPARRPRTRLPRAARRQSLTCETCEPCHTARPPVRPWLPTMPVCSQL